MRVFEQDEVLREKNMELQSHDHMTAPHKQPSVWAGGVLSQHSSGSGFRMFALSSLPQIICSPFLFLRILLRFCKYLQNYEPTCQPCRKNQQRPALVLVLVSAGFSCSTFQPRVQRESELQTRSLIRYHPSVCRLHGLILTGRWHQTCVLTSF